MAKRELPDLSKLLTATATPMSDAAEPPPALRPAANDIPAAAASETLTKPRSVTRSAGQDETATANLENLNFKVPRSFRKRFRDCAYRAELKHNELLFEALDAWETLRKGNG